MNEVIAALENPSVWNEPKRAQELGREKKQLEDVVGTIDHLKSNLSDNLELYEMAKADDACDHLPASAAGASPKEFAAMYSSNRGRTRANQVRPAAWQGVQLQG